MKARMQPIGNVFGKFPRVVRDLAESCGKKVRLEIDGKETELDRTIIEAIKDPLTHLVRNAIDHGIERPEVRQSQGKPATGCLHLRAYHENGQVVIEVSDDGAGIDPERVARKAIERGLITHEQAGRLSEREIIRHIFLPGFSTAEAVTNVSGRGVGMDVVKTNIETIGGSLDLRSRVGSGTTLRVRIPLTLAIIPALIVESAGDRYAIPQVNLTELVRLDSEDAQRAIERIRDTPVFRLRGSLLPLVYLHEALGLPGHEMCQDQGCTIIVLHADGRQFGVVVERVHDTQEIVVKPLSRHLKHLPLYAGAAVMGDGRVALILDVPNLSQGVGSVSTASASTTADVGSDHRPFLICRQGESTRLAVPLEQVARLEVFSPDVVEHSNGREVVQYRGRIMPLVRLSNVFGGGRHEETPLRVVVHSGGRDGVGIVVDEIVDIVRDQATILRKAEGPGLSGTAVIQKRVTDLLDIQDLLQSVDPRLLPTSSEGAST